MKTASIVAVFVGLGAALAACAAGAGAPPPPPLEQSEGVTVLALQERAEIGGVAVTPLRVEEDSRCPTGVQCIQAGTVRAAVRIEEGRAVRDIVLTLDEPVGLERGRQLILGVVCPYPRDPGTIAPSAYRFTFVVRRETSPPQPVIACLP